MKTNSSFETNSTVPLVFYQVIIVLCGLLETIIFIKGRRYIFNIKDNKMKFFSLLVFFSSLMNSLLSSFIILIVIPLQLQYLYFPILGDVLMRIEAFLYLSALGGLYGYQNQKFLAVKNAWPTKGKWRYFRKYSFRFINYIVFGFIPVLHIVVQIFIKTISTKYFIFNTYPLYITISTTVGDTFLSFFQTSLFIIPLFLHEKNLSGVMSSSSNNTSSKKNSSDKVMENNSKKEKSKLLIISRRNGIAAAVATCSTFTAMMIMTFWDIYSPTPGETVWLVIPIDLLLNCACIYYSLEKNK
jgi:hypothetical protein